jgi:hypothetical protein
MHIPFPRKMNMEPDKCAALEFHDLHRLPTSTIDYVRRGIDDSMRGNIFSEWHSWSGLPLYPCRTQLSHFLSLPLGTRALPVKVRIRRRKRRRRAFNQRAR